METNKKLQNLIGNAIGKDYFKLEFGCKLISTDNSIWIIAGKGRNTNGNTFLLSKDGSDMDIVSAVNVGYTKEQKHLILGQEPTLNDVLLAIGSIPLNHHYIDDTGRVFEWADDDFCKFTYNLEKSLFNQEEEVKVALIGLLEGK